MSNDTATDEDIVAYKNLNTNEIHLSDGVNTGLEARPNFVRVSLAEVPPSVIDGARRAQTERRQIEAAAATRRDGGFTSEAASGAVVPTAAHQIPEPVHDTRGVLSRPGMRDVQIGDKPWEHPAGQEALNAKANYDREHPDRRGVLARGDTNSISAPTVRETLLPPAVHVTDTTAPAEDVVDDGTDGDEGGSDDDPAGDGTDGGSAVPVEETGPVPPVEEDQPTAAPVEQAPADAEPARESTRKGKRA